MNAQTRTGWIDAGGALALTRQCELAQVARARCYGHRDQHGRTRPHPGQHFVERLWRSIKHEDVYLKGYDTVADLTLGLTEYFIFYNGERPHQALGNRTPDAIYVAGVGGGASIPDHFSERGTSTLASTGQRRSAAIEAVDAA